MSLIHENLYRSESAAVIGASDYIRRLARDLMAAYALRAGNIGLELDVADVALAPDSAFPCGLIMNELVSNALKHAFPGGRPGMIRIGLRQDGGDFVLTVADDGIGLPADVDALSGGSLGLRLVRNLAGQLGGTLSVETGAGARFIVRFPSGPRFRSRIIAWRKAVFDETIEEFKPIKGSWCKPGTSCRACRPSAPSRPGPGR